MPLTNKSYKSWNNYQMIWETVKQVPKGKISSYGEIAKLCGLIGQARLVGYALHNLPRGTDVPWFRIINSKGRISFPMKSSAYRHQRKLLEKEGIVFIDSKIDLEKYSWLRQMTHREK